MATLALDTATAQTSVAIVSARGEVLAEASHRDARRHAEVLPQLVRRVLAASHTPATALDHVAVGVGPGPFTGLRVGVALARATAHALRIPAIGVMTLDVIARGQRDRVGGPITVVTRSRRVEVAWATYDDPSHRAEGPLILGDTDFPRRGVVIGDIDGVDEIAFPSAAHLGLLVRERLAAGEPHPSDREWPEDSSDGVGAPTAAILAAWASQGRWLLPALPLYLRRPDAVPA